MPDPKGSHMKKSLEDIKRILRKEMSRLRVEFSVDRLELFGSYVRGDQTEESDIDILVTYIETPGLFGLLDLEYHLTDLLGSKVDLGTRAGLKEHVKPYVLAEAISV